MYIFLVATDGAEYRLKWWHIAALVDKKQGVTRVYTKIGDVSSSFDVAQSGADLEAAIQKNKTDMDLEV
jgi:hypothetical protein